MIPNITKGTGFRGLFVYLLVDKQTGQPRPEAYLIGGTLAGLTVAQLTAEMGLIRRLRPQVDVAVLHHSLSYAATEDPDDDQIRRDVQRYLEHMGLERFPHALIVHRDKGCIHVHIPINRIGDMGQLANDWYDQLRSQKAAAFVEREFGLVEVERPKMRERIDREWAQLQQDRADIHQAEPQPLARPELAGELGIKEQIRIRLVSIPAGLSLPEWYEAAEMEGVHLVPNMGTEKLTGWSVQLKGTESAPLALGKAFMSWNKLLETGRVIYNPEEHFAFALKCKEIKHDKPAVALKPAAPPATGSYPRDWRTLVWDWQPADLGLPRLQGHDLVERMVGPGLRAGAFGRRVEAPAIGQVRRHAEGRASGSPMGSDWAAVSHLAPSVPGPLARVRFLRPETRDAYLPRSPEHLAGRRSLGGSTGGPQPHFGFAPGRSGSRPWEHHRGQAPAGSDRLTDLRGVPPGGVSPGSSGGPGGRARSSGIGICADRRSLAALSVQEIVRRAIEPFREVLAGVGRILQDLSPKSTSAEIHAEATQSEVIEATFEALDALHLPVATKKMPAKASEVPKQPDPPKVPAQEKLDKDRKRANR